MNNENQCVPAGIGAYIEPQRALQADCAKEPAMNLKKHKRLTDLAYRVKDFIDGNGGLNYEEACQFGQIMTGIINLK